jgi:hypothetical protein
MRDVDLLFYIAWYGGVMNPLSPNQILRNLENGFFMTHKEQEEAAQYIRELQQINAALRESLIMNAEEVQRLRQQFGLWNKGKAWTSE